MDLTTYKDDAPARPLTDIQSGLSEQQISEHISEGLINGVIDVPTKSVKQILKSNFFTLFNILNVILALMVIVVGRYKSALFLGLVFCNVFIGLIQELRSKKTIDKLSLLSAPRASVLRCGEITSVDIKDVLLDDIMILQAGNEICADCVVVDGEVEVNESLLTGEQDPIVKHIGDNMMSGSFIVSGYAKAQVTKIGQDNYASKISAGAKYIKKTNSEILRSVNGIIRLMTFIIIPLSMILLLKNLANIDGLKDFADVMETTVGQIIGMIPEGLVLLTTLVFAASVIRLAKHKTLVQDLYCIETLARVNVLCLDKTGTITTGSMQVDSIIPLTVDESEISLALSAMVGSLSDNNPTFNALKEAYVNNPNWKVLSIVPFSSARKFSAVSFDKHGSYIVGAGEFILKDKYSEIADVVAGYSAEGKRVLTLCHTNEQLTEDNLPSELTVLGLVLITDQIRPEAYETLAFFAEQGVDIKVISGDNPITVSKIASKAGLAGADKYVDASTLTTTEDLERAILNNKVFGRVTPDQKLAFVKILKKYGKTVAMTGDGVNDVLALKEADCSIAMASGSDAARNVSSLVLLDNNFASMPKVVAEGRRGINNLQRSSSLFLIKTIYATIFALLFVFIPYVYPFKPIQLTLISSALVGMPSVILALEPNREVIKGSFINNAITSALPGSLCVILTIMIMLVFANLKIPSIQFYGLDLVQQSTLATIILGMVMAQILYKICMPFSVLRSIVFTLAILSFITCILFFSGFFSINPVQQFNTQMIAIIIPILVLTYPFMILCRKIVSLYFEKSKFDLMEKLLEVSENISLATNKEAMLKLKSEEAKKLELPNKGK